MSSRIRALTSSVGSKLLIGATDRGTALVRYHAPDHLAERHGLSVSERHVLRIVESIATATRSTT